MIKDRYGVVNDEERDKYEKKWQIPCGYEFISFNYKKAEDFCKDAGKGFVVERISSHYGKTNERQIIYRRE